MTPLLQDPHADEAAGRLLASFIGEDAYARFSREGGIFIVPAKRCSYLFWRPETYLVLKSAKLHHTYASIYKRYVFDRREYFRYGCALFVEERLPKDDMVLAFYLAIKTDVKGFNKTLNWYDPMWLDKDFSRLPVV